MLRRFAAGGVTLFSVLSLVLLGGASPASAANGGCQTKTLSTDVQYGVCMWWDEAGPSTDTVYGSYNGLPLQPPMVLVYGGKIVSSYSPSRPETNFSHDMGNFPVGSKYKVCVKNLIGYGTLCTSYYKLN